MAIKMHAALAVHAGEWLRTEFVEPYGITIKALADHVGVTRQALSTLLNGHSSLSAEMAIRFEKAFGVKAETLMRMQTAYQLANARAHEDKVDIRPLAKVA
ncbi:HigA family addiction module antidote protein (plasmid) [Asticcacaulis sp. DW145]|jgi:addiction module HigA family antidote|uniref:HigA family addiction module antitoxin n=1 Tax=Asticcacaulis currens TaxID=2984210 RepID=A0ABT5IDF3_9CAUL|nr:HigA family addiction module antitoxin [Asticcacaulis currens]MDC7694206.1 HigA family addiction module antitoxin [Asticcacaulis currens]BEV12966.1 HigA family addiction module antidote protein [Asticcacaulis sp. DW145]